jgi:hypothetical protein
MREKRGTHPHSLATAPPFGEDAGSAPESLGMGLNRLGILVPRPPDCVLAGATPFCRGEAPLSPGDPATEGVLVAEADKARFRPSISKSCCFR